MNPLVVSDFGSRLSVSHWRLRLDSELKGAAGEWQPRSFPYDSVVFLTHNGSVTLEALRWLSTVPAPLFVLDWRGRLQSAVLHKRPPMGGLRLAQYRAAADQHRSEQIATAIVREKLARSGVVGASTEPSAARAYWQEMGERFRKLGYEWRSRRNNGDILNWKATTIPNSCINYSYACLESLLRRDINSVGLDPAIGFLHRSRGYNDPLVFDMMELWRWLADIAVLRFLNEQRLRERDFQRAEDYSLKLLPERAKQLVQSVADTFASESASMSLSNLVVEDVRVLARFLVAGSGLGRWSVRSRGIRTVRLQLLQEARL